MCVYNQVPQLLLPYRTTLYVHSCSAGSILKNSSSSSSKQSYMHPFNIERKKNTHCIYTRVYHHYNTYMTKIVYILEEFHLELCHAAEKRF